jgi:hypothetical protein
MRVAAEIDDRFVVHKLRYSRPGSPPLKVSP